MQPLKLSHSILDSFSEAVLPHVTFSKKIETPKSEEKKVKLFNIIKTVLQNDGKVESPYKEIFQEEMIQKKLAKIVKAANEAWGDPSDGVDLEEAKSRAIRKTIKLIYDLKSIHLHFKLSVAVVIVTELPQHRENPARMGMNNRSVTNLSGRPFVRVEEIKNDDEPSSNGQFRANDRYKIIHSGANKPSSAANNTSQNFPKMPFNLGASKRDNDTSDSDTPD